MSKAFTKEGDDGSDGVVIPPRVPLPAGVPNYVTARGVARLRVEMVALEQERARQDAIADDEVEHKRRHAIIAGRIADLAARIGSAVVVDGRAQPHDEVRFGATVSLRPPAGAQSAAREARRFTIVGVDEANGAEGRIAFVSPLARALLGQRVGDVVSVPTKGGTEELEIVAIEYDAAEADG